MRRVSFKPQGRLAVLFCGYHREGGGSKPHLTDRNVEAQRGPQTTPAVAPFHDTPEAVWEWHELGTKYPEEMSERGLQVGGGRNGTPDGLGASALRLP